MRPGPLARLLADSNVTDKADAGTKHYMYFDSGSSG